MNATFRHLSSTGEPWQPKPLPEESSPTPSPGRPDERVLLNVDAGPDSVHLWLKTPAGVRKMVDIARGFQGRRLRAKAAARGNPAIATSNPGVFGHPAGRRIYVIPGRHRTTWPRPAYRCQ